MKIRIRRLAATPWLRDTRGGMAEYLILTVVIAVGAITSSRALRESLVNNFTTTATDMGNGALRAPGP